MVEVARERCFLDASMDAGFLVCLEGRCLSVRETGFDSTFGEGPSAAARLHQQELKVVAVPSVADGRDLADLTEPVKPRWMKYLCGRFRSVCSGSRTRIAHAPRVLDTADF